MPIRFVCQLDDNKNVRLGIHVAFQWNGCPVIQTACGIELNGENEE